MQYQYNLTDPILIKINKSKTIQIYENDLKYINNNNIDLSKVDNYNSGNKDTLEYRIDECIKNKMITLDLSHLNLNFMPNIPILIQESVKYLFLAENNIVQIDSLINYKNLLVLDICSNKLKTLPILSGNIEEIIIRKNNITDIGNILKCPNLKRLDCSNNNIKFMPKSNSLNILICHNNKIEKISDLKNLVKLSCRHNLINIISNLDNLKILDCGDNKLDNIGKFEKLEELYCGSNIIRNIDLKLLDSIKVIHCQKTLITKLDYTKSLKEFMCNYNDDFILSGKYNIDGCDVSGKDENNIALIKFK
jgi:Leucine-rich repeat (LRR) protein